MTSEDQRFEQVKNEIEKSEKPKKHLKEKNVETTIGEIKKEFSSFEKEKQSKFFDDDTDQKTSNKIKSVLFLCVVLLIVLIIGTKLIGLW